MRDRAISAKFLAHTVYMQDILLNSQKLFLFPKMAAILNFQILTKMVTLKIACISLTVWEQFQRNFWPVGYVCKMLSSILKKNFPLSKNGGHFEFSHFGQKW